MNACKYHNKLWQHHARGVRSLDTHQVQRALHRGERQIQIGISPPSNIQVFALHGILFDRVYLIRVFFFCNAGTSHVPSPMYIALAYKAIREVTGKVS